MTKANVGVSLKQNQPLQIEKKEVSRKRSISSTTIPPSKKIKKIDTIIVSDEPEVEIPSLIRRKRSKKPESEHSRDEGDTSKTPESQTIEASKQATPTSTISPSKATTTPLTETLGVERVIDTHMVETQAQSQPQKKTNEGVPTENANQEQEQQQQVGNDNVAGRNDDQQPDVEMREQDPPLPRDHNEREEEKEEESKDEEGASVKNVDGDEDDENDEEEEEDISEHQDESPPKPTSLAGVMLSTGDSLSVEE